MRTPVTLKIKFKSANLDQFIERYSVDVSRGGIFIRTKEPLPVGTQLKFEFQLQDSQPLISGEGTVVWIREHDPTRTGVAPGMGVRFDRLAPQSQQVLDRILSEKQRLDAGLEGKFHAPRAAAPAVPGSALPEQAGTIDNRARPSPRLSTDRTPLPDPSPFGGETLPGEEEPFGARESTRVMLPEQTEELKQQARQEPVLIPPILHPASPPAGTGSRPGPLRRPTPAPPSAPIPSASPLAAAPPRPIMSSAAPPVPGEPQGSGLTVTLAPPPSLGQRQPSDKSADAVVAAPSPPAEPAQREPAKPYLPRVTPEKPAERGIPDAVASARAEPEPSVAPVELGESPVEQPGEGNGHSREGVPQSEWFSGVDSGRTGSQPVQVDEQRRPGVASRARDQTDSVRALAGGRKSSVAPALAVLLLAVVGVGGDLYWSTQHEATQPAATPAAQPRPQPQPPQAAAKAPAPPATAPAGLSIPVTSTPPGAQVALDSKEQPGATPSKLEGLQAGKSYQVKLALKGYHPYETKLEAKAGVEVAVALVALPRWVEVASNPPGAAVFLDGKKVGATPTTVKNLDLAKPHKLEIKKPGFEDIARDLTSGDEWQDKPDHSELALAVDLVKKEEPPPVVRRPKRPRPAKPVETTGEQPTPSESGETPAAETPAADKPAPEKEKPEKPAPGADKPTPEKDKPAAPTEGKPDLKTPDWLKK